MMEEGQLFCYLLLLLAVTGAAPVNAQPQPIAFGGAAGIYVFNPFDPCTPQKPNAKGAVKYKLERRETGGQWQAVGIYSGPASESELTKAYHRYYKYVLGPEFTNPNAVLKLWQQYNRTPRWDSLGQFFFDRAAALAVCYQFIDTTARTGTSYEYQVSQLDKNDRVLNSYTSTAVQYPNKAAFKNTAKLSAAEGTQLQAYVVWKQECATRPVFYRVYRKDGPMSDFQLLQNAANITRVGNTSTYQLELRDRSTGANQMYLYYIVPVDGLGNTGEPSDTALVKTYETKDILTPQYFSAEKLPGKRGVLLTWKLHHYQSVAGIEVFRCDNYDGNYTKIGTADETDTSYTDLTATPSKVYYYYLQIIDRFSKSSLRTARTSALYQDTRAPRAPRYVTAAMQGDKVKVSWVTADPEIAGYYVYRSVGHDTVYTLISDFITAKDSITTFIDATNDFKSPYGYSYTVTQENISHVSSKYAYPAYLPAQIKQADAPVPMHIEAGPGKKGVMVFWDDMQNYSGVVGYKLQRRTLGKGDYLPVSDGMLSVSRNFYADTTVRQGNVYEYAVQTVMAGGNTSVMSDAASIAFGDATVTAPVGLSYGFSETGTGVELTWSETDSARVKQVIVYRVEKGGTTPLKLTTTEQNSYTDLTAAKGKAYYYYLVAVGPTGTESEKGKAVYVEVE
jgi:fibronectin type 3 domain-containing protein